MYNRSELYNVRFIEMKNEYDINDQLNSIGVDPENVGNLIDKFRFYSMKVENVDTRGANLVEQCINQLGGVVAMNSEAKAFTVRFTDLLLSGSRHMFSLLVIRLKKEPFGLDELAGEIKKCIESDNGVMMWNGRVLDFHKKTYVMGILNSTPDSFFDESRIASVHEAVERAEKMIKAGVDIIDIGGESSRPGSDSVSEEEEIRRVIPVVQAIREKSDIIISVDTRKKNVAERALDSGADIINDISGLQNNMEMAKLIAKRKTPVILMHIRGIPKNMQKNPYYKNTVSEILRELQSSISKAMGAGISHDKIIIDPGIGFGKRVEDNLKIIRELQSFKSLNFPVLIGLSRKSFIGQILDKPVEKRLIGTIVANTVAILNGANIIRVHDVDQTVEMVKIIESIRNIEL
ncbi:MAG: dihydropteroate synthase [Spirochaetes bacterium]|nr:dihydropteroate synthase [Spirochaetota bacterium]